LLPSFVRKAENEEEHEDASASVAGFRAAYVFDVSQTDGQELPQIGIVQGSQAKSRASPRFAMRGISVESRFAWLACTIPICGNSWPSVW